MPVYVDALFVAGVHVGRLGPDTKWCHMFTTGDLEELHAMAEAIGMKRAWFQNHTWLPHYDLVASKRAKAVKLGAIEVDRAEYVRLTRPIMEAFAAAKRAARGDS